MFHSIVMEGRTWRWPEPANRYLEGNFAPVHEEVTATDLPVTGTIPDHLDGRYLRNGPNPVVAPDPAAYHWFLGAGMVHGVRLRDGRAEWYRNRWVRSARRGRGAGRGGEARARCSPASTLPPTPTSSATPVAPSPSSRPGGRPYELTDELDTVGPCDFDGTLPGGYTAHPTATPRPASCTPSPTSSGGATRCSTR